MSERYEDRVSTVVVTEAPGLQCAIGSHHMTATITVNDTWVYTTIDGLPICPEHIILLADTRTASTIPESRIKRILIDRDEKRARQHSQERVRKNSARSQPGWIYYLSIDGLIKIGYTSNLENRMKAYPPNTQLLALHPGTKATEADLHQQFAESKARGREWFTPGTRIIEHIESVLERFGKPDGVFKPMRHARTNARAK